jgi:flagellar biosynthesis/type III secretory pathway M-ring protein FliF/YscJ
METNEDKIEKKVYDPLHRRNVLILNQARNETESKSSESDIIGEKTQENIKIRENKQHQKKSEGTKAKKQNIFNVEIPLNEDVKISKEKKTPRSKKIVQKIADINDRPGMDYILYSYF